MPVQRPSRSVFTRSAPLNGRQPPHRPQPSGSSAECHHRLSILQACQILDHAVLPGQKRGMVPSWGHLSSAYLKRRFGKQDEVWPNASNTPGNSSRRPSGSRTSRTRASRSPRTPASVTRRSTTGRTNWARRERWLFQGTENGSDAGTGRDQAAASRTGHRPAGA